MKKLVLTILTIFYLGVSSGATVHFHYCMGQLIEWGLSDTNPDQCSSCGRPESETEKCCKDQSQQFKVEKSQKAAPSAYEFNLPELDLSLTSFIETQHMFSSSLREENYLSIQPPRTQSIPAFIRNRNFRI
ncbi:hypothetical protein [Daejeonella sp.]|uniref:HYC_CC_PP family protein n=1 Tax=Daejeonella sp. TaxID=2805397 RepID=UPI0030BBA19D